MDRTKMENALERCEFFKGMEKGTLASVIDLCRPLACEAGEYLFRQGDFGDHLYVIVEGQVYLDRKVDLGERRGSVTVTTLGRGRVLGCWSTLLGEPHILMCSASCRKPTTVLEMSGSDLRRLMVENKGLGFDILERLSFLLRDRVQSAYGALEKI